jgi:hypothetical protein
LQNPPGDQKKGKNRPGSRATRHAGQILADKITAFFFFLQICRTTLLGPFPPLHTGRNLIFQLFLVLYGSLYQGILIVDYEIFLLRARARVEH